MSLPQRAGAIVIGALFTLATVALSNVRIPVHRGSEALLRVAMSARPERIEQCRAVSDSELANTPAHMRQQTICEGSAAAYLLEIMRNGTVLATDTVRGGGLRNDRQLYVLSDFVVPSGVSEIEVRVRRIGEPASDSVARTDDIGSATAEAGSEDRERVARARRAADAIPPQLDFRETVTLDPREIILVTYDRETRRLRSSRAP